MKTVEQDLIKRLVKLLDDANELISDIDWEISENEDADYLYILKDDLIEIEAYISDIVYDEERDDIENSWYNLTEAEVDDYDN